LAAVTAIIGELLLTNLSLLVERAALLFLTGLIMAYALAFIIVGIRTSSFGHVAYVVIALILFALVNGDRARQIRQYVYTLRSVYAQLPDHRGGV
jgi:hypothetical protein